MDELISPSADPVRVRVAFVTKSFAEAVCAFLDSVGEERGRELLGQYYETAPDE